MLRRGEPVEITLVNQLARRPPIHWHGMELESYYDGVHGFSGIGPRQTPMIDAGGRSSSASRRRAPARSSTTRTCTITGSSRRGCTERLVVVEPGETFDPATDHVLVLGRSGLTSGVIAVPDSSTPVVVNGERSPRLVWTAGAAASPPAHQHHARRHLRGVAANGRAAR